MSRCVLHFKIQFMRGKLVHLTIEYICLPYYTCNSHQTLFIDVLPILYLLEVISDSSNIWRRDWKMEDL